MQKYHFASKFLTKTSNFTLFQSAAKLNGSDVRGRGSNSKLSHRNVHILRGLLRSVPFLLRQHLRCLDYHHLPRARRGGTAGRRNRQKSGQANEHIYCVCNRCVTAEGTLHNHAIFRRSPRFALLRVCFLFGRVAEILHRFHDRCETPGEIHAKQTKRF
jgi:hypothetical protein